MERSLREEEEKKKEEEGRKEGVFFFFFLQVKYIQEANFHHVFVMKSRFFCDIVINMYIVLRISKICKSDWITSIERICN